jgi:hypothetical protein
MSETALTTVAPPEAGVWRVARNEHRLDFPQQVVTSPEEPGYRFDDLTGATQTLYFASSPEAALTEVIVNALIPKSDLSDLLPDDDTIGAGILSAAYLANRKLFKAEFAPSVLRPSRKFVDLELATNLAALSAELDPILRQLIGLGPRARLTLADVHGENRVLTRGLATHIATQRDDRGVHRYSGIRYVSKFGTDHECWAAFSGTRPQALATEALDKHHPAVEAVARVENIRFN